MEGRILIIEDHEGNRELLSQRFEEEGLEVATAETGAEGIQAAVRSIPQAILISTSLPDMPGTDVVKRMREITRVQHVWAMMMGDEENRTERLEGLKAGANDFVTSPLDPDLISLRVRNAINRKNLDNTTDPVTGMPAGRSVQDELMRLVRDPEGEWALMRLTIRYLNPFREAYGFMAGDDMLRGTSRILAEALSADAVEDDFLGYGGRNDFIVITQPQRTESLVDEVKAQFNEEIGSYYNFFDRERGHIEFEGKEYPLAELRVRTVTPADGPFYDIRSLTEELGG